MQIPIRRFIPLLAAALAAVPLAVSAQTTAQPPPSYAVPAPAPPPPPQPPPSYASGDESISGRVLSFNGAYDLRVRDDRGYVDNVKLHKGTVISPTGLTLAPGMAITVHGRNEGPFFAADDIETPYTITDPILVYPYYPYSYPAYRFGLGFHFR